MEKQEIDIVSHTHNEDVVRSFGSSDEVAEEAKGGSLDDMPKGYYRNWRFIGSVAAVVFLAQGSYLGRFVRSMH